ncbi:MAG: hypothetical protein AAFO94_23275, partial [Bacteroidota bacterium]
MCWLRLLDGAHDPFVNRVDEKEKSGTNTSKERKRVIGGGGDDFMDGGTGIDTVDYRHWDGGGTYNLLTEVASFSGY